MNMILPMYLLWLLFVVFGESSGQIVITQTPSSVTVLPGETVTIQCKASSSMSNDMQLHLFKSGQNPKLLIYNGNSRFTGVPDRFSGQYSGTDFTFTITGVQAEDAGEYYCQQDNSTPFTFGKGTTVEIKLGGPVKPTVSIFPPSADQLKGGTATVVCLVNGFYPGGLNVAWKKDTTTATTGVLTSTKQQDPSDHKYSLSSTLTLTKAEYDSYQTYTCEVTHETGAIVKSIKRSECSQ